MSVTKYANMSATNMPDRKCAFKGEIA